MTSRKSAQIWISEQETGYARTIQEKAKFLVSRVMVTDINIPRPSTWWEVLKLAAGLDE